MSAPQISSSPRTLPKPLRKHIKNLYKQIDTQSYLKSPTTPKDFIVLTASLPNGELPFEIPLSALQPTTDIDLFQEEYLDLLYKSFDTYSTLPEFLKELAEDKKQHLIEKEKRKANRKLTPFEKYINYLYSEQNLRRKRMWLLHTLRRILTVKTGVEHDIPHYYPNSEVAPKWYPKWIIKREKMNKIDDKITDIVQEEMFEELVEKEKNEKVKPKIQTKAKLKTKSVIKSKKVIPESKQEDIPSKQENTFSTDKEKQVQEQLAKLQAMFNS